MFLYFFNTLLLLFEVLQLIVKCLGFVLESAFRKIVPPPKRSVERDVVLITGAGHGLGRELSTRFAQLGAKVVLWDINKTTAQSVADQLNKSKPGCAFAYQCDVTDEQQVESLSLRVRREVGDVTLLVNNAGILHCQPMMKLNNQQIRRTFEVNLLAHYWTIRMFLPRMIEIGRGHIVAIASVASLVGTVNMTDYCASKFGVRGLMEALSEELFSMNKEKVINLTTVCPLTFNTGMAKRPKTRFPKLMPIMDLSQVASYVMDAILRNKDMIVIPPRIGMAIAYRDLFPKTVKHLVQQFLDYESLAHSPSD